MSYGEIPKIIHYCWFGRKEKPGKVKDCINSWHKYLDDYEFIEKVSIALKARDIFGQQMGDD